MNLLDALEDFSHRETSERDKEKLINQIELLVLACNQEAMKYLRENNLTLSLDLLRKAEKLLSEEYKENKNETTYKLIGVTLNNLGCYYKKTNKPKVALGYLTKALKIEVTTLQDKLNIASTHLNICAIYSSLAQHQEAIKHVKLALELLETEKSNYLIKVASTGDKKKNEEENNESEMKYKSIATTIIMAYYNYGVELEHIKDLENSLKTLTKGFELSSRELGPDHSLTDNIRQTILMVVDKKKNLESKIQKRDDYMIKVIEQNKSMIGEPEKLGELSLKDGTRKASSVQRSLGKPYLGNKSRKKATKKNVEKSMEVPHHDVSSTYVSQTSLNGLPEIKQRVKREAKPPLRGRRVGSSVEENNHDETNNQNVTLPRIQASQDLANVATGNEPQKFKRAYQPLKKKPPVQGRNSHQPLEAEIKDLDSQILKLQGEILQIDGDKNSAGITPAPMLGTPSHREYATVGARPIYESNMGNPLEFGSRLLESDSSRLRLNAHYQDRMSYDQQPLQRGSGDRSRSPEDDKHQEELKTRFLKHRYFIPKRNIPPVQLKKNLYSYRDDNGQKLSSMRSIERAIVARPKPVDSKPNIEESENETQRNKISRGGEQKPSNNDEKVQAYMQYFN